MWAKIFAEENVRKAMSGVKKGTVPGGMGFDTGYYDDQKEMLAPHLSELFMNVATSGDMTAAMKEAVITVLHKGKGKDEEEVTSYRPVSITHAHYRIMTKAIGMQSNYRQR